MWAKKRWLRPGAVMVALVVALGVAGCGGGSSSDDTEAPVSRDITVVLQAEPGSLDTIYDLTRDGMVVQHAILDTLLTYDENYELQPGLAESWERVDDLNWRFTIRDDVKFTNGEPMNAEAVAFSILTTRDTPGQLAGYLQPMIADAKAESEYSVLITTKAPASQLVPLMGFQHVYPPVAYEKAGKDFGKAPIGTGPFQFVEWKPGQEIKVTRNPDYWAGDVDVESMTFRWAGDPQARQAMLDTGEADILMGVSPQTAPQIEASETAHLVTRPSLRQYYLGLNTKWGPFQDIRVRRAVAHAIDRDTIVSAVFQDRVKATTSILNELVPGSGPNDEAFRFDPEESRQLLKEADAVGTEIPFYVPAHYVLGDAVGEAVAEMLKDVGFKVKLEVMEAGAFFDLALAQNMPGMHLLSNGIEYAHGDQLMKTAFYSKGLLQYCADPKLDKKIEDAVGIFDDEERNRAYQEIGTYIANELVCWIPMYNDIAMIGVSNDIKDLLLMPTGRIQFQSIRFAG